MRCGRWLTVSAATLALSGCLQSTELGGASSLVSGSGGLAGNAQGADSALKT
jgi:hypothetical protein